MNYKYDEKELDSPETLEAVETLIKNDINEKSTLKMNREQRRALAKKMGKKGRNEFGTISETAKKLNYISLIEKLREINKEKENKKNEDFTKNN